MLQAGYIVNCERSELAACNHTFLKIEKKRHRPIFNGTKINDFISTPNFTMCTPYTPLAYPLLCWYGKIDLSNAYNHIDIAPEF